MYVLGVRPYPKESESLMGYLFRLAKVNGAPDLFSLMKRVGVKRTQVKSIHYWDHDLASEVISKLAPFLNREPAKIFPDCSWQYDRNLVFKEHRMLQDMRVCHVRICSECLKEKAQFDWRWTLAHIAHCPRHQCQLLDACPHCGSLFKLKSELYKQCPHCGLQWNELQTKPSQPSPMEMAIWNHFEKASDTFSKPTDAILTTIVFLARPYDSTHQQCKRLPAFSGYTELVSLAYSMLQSKETQSQWISSCRRERAEFSVTGELFSLLPIKAWTESLEMLHYPIEVNLGESVNLAEPTISLPELSAFVPKQRLKLASNPEDLRIPMPADNLLHILPQKVLDYPSLKRAFAPSMLIPPAKNKRAFVDLRLAVKQINNVIKCPEYGWIKITQKLLTKEQRPNYSSIIVEILLGNLKGLIGDLSFSEIYLPPDTADELFQYGDHKK